MRRLGLRRHKAREASVGSRPSGLGRTIVGNDGQLIIGDDVVIESTPAPGHLVTGPGGRISIGDRVRIGPGAAISAEDSVSIGDDAVLGSFVTIMDTDFHVAGDSSVPAVAVPVVVEPGATIGHQAILLPGTRVGAGASIAPGSVVSGTVLPATSVAGNPAVAVDPDGVDDSPAERPRSVRLSPASSTSQLRRRRTCVPTMSRTGTRSGPSVCYSHSRQPSPSPSMSSE